MQIIANDAWKNCALLRATDTAEAETSDQAGVRNVAQGRRSLYWEQSGSAARRLCYINKTTAFSVDSLVMVRADRHVGKAVSAGYWSTYPTTRTAIFTAATWAPTLVGPREQDFIQTGISAPSAKALDVTFSSTDYTKKVGQIFFGQAFEMPEINSFTTSPAFTTIIVEREAYLVEERALFSFANLTRSEIETFERLNELLEVPLFLYDASGIVLYDKLWHAVLRTLTISQAMTDYFGAQLEIYRLRTHRA